MKKAFIKAISYYLPSKELTNADLANSFPEWSIDKIEAKTGIKTRRIADLNEFASDMAIKASNLLFEKYNIDRNSIDFILFCTQSPDYFLPTTACILQQKLNLSTGIGALDYNLGCSGYVYGLALAKGLIISNIANNVLLITSETYSKYTHSTDRVNRTIFGDAAAATLVSDNGFAEILNFELGTDGEGANNLIVKEGGSRYKLKRGEFPNNNAYPHGCLYMNGPEIFTFTTKMVPALVKKLLLNNNLNEELINLYVLHQANRYMLEFLRKIMKIPEDKFMIYLENIGNTVSSTIPIALLKAIEDNRTKGNVLLAGFGVGYSWGGTVLKFKDEI
jgi:3-oxoacyl-[acyl-carrier-protein] synthase-3